MAVLRPITKKEVVPGRRYINVLVYSDGSMHLEILRLYSKPIKARSGWRVRTEKKKKGMSKRDDLSYNFTFAEGLGLDPHPENDNHHRLFPDTPRNRRVLGGLVRRQSLRKYLELIGFKDPRKPLEEISWRADMEMRSEPSPRYRG